MASTPFASVKLPNTLVEQARQAAQPMHRSVASHLEYWATRGQLVSHDKHGKINFFAALYATEIQGGKADRYAYDLLKKARKK